jgi:hypothetical protein
MKQGYTILLTIVAIFFMVVFISGSFQIFGMSTSGGPQGPTEEQFACMESCVLVGCSPGDVACANANSPACSTQCGIEDAGPLQGDDDIECMNDCISQGCGVYDYQCRNANMAECETECGMAGDAPDDSTMSNEQICISECVAREDPTVICGSSQEGETGNELCQQCANECVHLYEGPCLSDEELTEKEEDCKTCKHCYGEPIMGPSGEGWDCIIDVECEDASSEFGDDPGNGPGISAIGNVFEGIADFFKGLFGGSEE